MRTDTIIQSIYGEDGYSTKIALMNDELEIFRKMIHTQWLYRIQLLVPEHIKKFEEYGITHYHELAHLLDHSMAWPTHARVFPREAVALVKEMSFFKKIVAEFGSIMIGDENDFGWGNIYWRLVRPGNADSGPLHADKWFWDLLDYHGKPPSFPFERLKIWIAVYTDPGKNGLLIIPGSHLKKDWKWHSEFKHNKNKPVIDEETQDLNTKLLSIESGRTVIFHDELLHGGSENLASTTRVSAEFTIFIPSRQEADRKDN